MKMKLNQIALCLATAAAMVMAWGNASAATVVSSSSSSTTASSSLLSTVAAENDSNGLKTGLNRCLKRDTENAYFKCVCRWRPDSQECKASHS
jgi:hypothetical protein